jgi:hypothetical protein
LDFQAIPNKIAQPARDELVALTSLELQCWMLIDGRTTLKQLAYFLNIHDAATMENIITKFQNKDWIRLMLFIR